MGKSQPEKTQLAELTLRDIANAGADLHEYAAVVPFTLEGNGQRAYIPTSVLRYYNPKVKLEPKDIRYLDPDFFEARIRDIGANPVAKPYQQPLRPMALSSGCASRSKAGAIMTSHQLRRKS